MHGQNKLENQAAYGYDYPKSAEDIFKSLFPSLYLSKKIDKSSEFQVNFSRKINRPNFMQIMPFIMNNDRQNIRRGNPDLKPEFINLAEMNYNKLFNGNNWLVSLYLRSEENPITTIASPSPTDSSVLITTFINGTAGTRYGLDNTLKLTLAKDLELTTNLNVFNIKIQTQSITNEGWAMNGKAGLSWKLPNKLKDFSVQLNSNFESNQIIAQGYRKGIAFTDFAVKYTFNRVASVTFTINDITNSRKEFLVLDQPYFYQESTRRRETRYFKLGFQMPFGKMDASIFRKMKDTKRQQGDNQNQTPDYGG